MTEPYYQQQQQQQQQPAGQYPGAPTPPPYGVAAPAPDPGRTLGIVGFVLSLLGPLTVAGLIVSIVALVKSRRAQRSNGLALAGTIIGAIGTLIGLVLTVLAIVGVVNIAQTCGDLGPGTHYVNGITYTCS